MNTLDLKEDSPKKLHGRNKLNKTKTCLLRLTEEDEQLIKVKSTILNTDRSKLLRNGLYSYWKNGTFDPDQILKLYNESDDNQKKHIVSLLVKYFRQKGYPHREMSSIDLKKDMNTLIKTKSPLIDENHLQKNLVGLSTANYFHPHLVKVKCLNKYHSPYEIFKDDLLLADAINRWLELGKKPDLSGIRRILRTRNGVKSVVNFKPVVAKYFYDNYVPINGSVLDPCAGYGGRLMGAISTCKNLFYHGIDPCGETAIGNMQLAGHYSRYYSGISEAEFPFRFSFSLGCAEDVMKTLPDKSYDLIFTSPPYFNVEKYDTVPNQSYLRYPIYDEWKEKFLFVLIQESFRILKTGGYLILNIKNYKKFKLADDLCQMSIKYGFKLVKTYYMRLANSEFSLKTGNTWHTEPIFVFQK